MHRRVVECVANFSEGRDLSVVDALEEAIGRGHGVALLHRTSDFDHHRSVLTFAGEPESVAAAAVRAVRVAAERIDLNRHKGVHPRLGAADVIPFVPVQGVTLQECADLARRAGEEIWRTLNVPVYLYEAAAIRPERKRLEVVRRGGFEAVRDASLHDAARAPDIGGPGLHPTAGACIVGARKFLVAWNVNLTGGSLDDAQQIARRIRASSGGFAAVKALGLALESRGQVQVSVNLTDLDVTPLHTVWEAIVESAGARGMTIAGSEIIGLIPRQVVDEAAERFLRFENFTSDTILETRIERELPATPEDLFDTLEDPARATGGGSAAAAAAAMAASLGILVCRIARLDSESLKTHRRFFSDAITADADAFAELMRVRQPPGDQVIHAALVPIAIAQRAIDLEAELRDLRLRTPERLVSDLDTALALARAAVEGARSTARMNIARTEDPETRQALEKQAEKLQ